MNFVNFAEL